jgi:hypothetical protein
MKEMYCRNHYFYFLQSFEIAGPVIGTTIDAITNDELDLSNNITFTVLRALDMRVSA